MDPRELKAQVISSRYLKTLVAVLASFMLASTASYSNESERYGYGITGNNLVFKTSDEARAGGSFKLAVKDGLPGSIQVELVDIYATSTGSKRSIPLGSSPFTPDQLVEFTESYPGYEPSAEFQYFDISFKFKPNVELDRPVLGGLSISIVPQDQGEGEAEEGTSVASAIVATFAYLPDSGLNLAEYQPGLSLTGPTIERVSEDFFPLNLIPDIPLLLNHGDLEASYIITNTGKIFLETSTQLVINQLGWLNWNPEPVFSSIPKEIFLVPGQQTSASIEIKPEAQSTELLGIGVYNFQTVATGTLGDQISTSTLNQQVLVIFPWKQSLIGLVLLVLFRKQLAKLARWVFEYAKSLREFQRTRKKQLPVATKPVALPKEAIETKPLAPKSYSSEPRPLYPTWYEPPSKNS